MKKTKLIQIRVSQEEYDYIHLKMNEKDFSNVSDFLRTSAITPLNLNKKKMISMIYEVNKIGVNLNQIVYKMNKENKIDNDLLTSVDLIKSQLDDVLISYKAF